MYTIGHTIQGTGMLQVGTRLAKHGATPGTLHWTWATTSPILDLQFLSYNYIKLLPSSLLGRNSTYLYVWTCDVRAIHGGGGATTGRDVRGVHQRERRWGLPRPILVALNPMTLKWKGT